MSKSICHCSAQPILDNAETKNVSITDTGIARSMAYMLANSMCARQAPTTPFTVVNRQRT